MSKDRFDMSSAGFVGTDTDVNSHHAMAKVSQDAASSSAVSATRNQNHKYEHVTAKVTSNKV